MRGYRRGVQEGGGGEVVTSSPGPSPFQNDMRRGPRTALPKYSKNREVFCAVKNDEMSSFHAKTGLRLTKKRYGCQLLEINLQKQVFLVSDDRTICLRFLS